MTQLVENAPILLVLFPMIGAGIALVGKTLPRVPAVRQVALVAQLPAALVLLGTASVATGETEVIRYALGGWSFEPGITLVLDGLAWLSAALIAVMTVIVGIASLSHRDFGAGYFFFLLMSSAGMQAVVLTSDLFTMFVAFEVVAVGVYVLIAWEQTPEGLLASLKYLFLSSVGILFFLIGVFLVYRDLGTLSLARITGMSVPLTDPAAGRLFFGAPMPGALAGAVAALTVGIGVRTAFIPFHTWLPEAHAWAPHPISALLSGVLIKVSFLALARIVTAFGAVVFEPVLLWIGAVTAFVAVVWALSQHDAKRLLAFHSISQMGFILAAWGAGGTLAAYGHAVSHALFKALLFVAVGIAIERVGSRDVFRMRGVARRAPLVAVALIVGALAISGVPPFNGFVSKALVSRSLYGDPAYLLLQVAAVGTAASFLKLLRILLPDRTADGTTARNPATRLPAMDSLALAVLVVLVAGTGVFGDRLVAAMAPVAGVTPPTSVYSWDAVIDALITVGLGALLALFVLSPVGQRITAPIAARNPALRTILVFLVAGLVLFWLVPGLAAGGAG